MAALPQALFEAASLTKPMFAWLALQQASEGRLRLDEPLVDTLRPTWLDDHPWSARITARAAERARVKAIRQTPSH